MADKRNPANDIENDDSTRMNEDEIVGRADDDDDDDEEFDDLEDEDEDEVTSDDV
jgi:hypothetical protein